MTDGMKIAIIGAGMAGLACGEQLAGQGHRIALFDKGRGPGGRMATRRMEEAGETLQFDHGAQYFTARDPHFVRAVSQWEAQGVVARWPEAGADAYVGTPGMNAPIRAMAAAQEVHFSVRIESFEPAPSGWILQGDGAPQDSFDAVVMAVPAEQAAPLLQPHLPDFAAKAASVTSAPCWTMMASLAGTTEARDCLRPGGVIGWAARNSAKPGRTAPLSGGENWVVQATPDWSREHLELEAAHIIPLMLEALEQELGALPPIRAVAAHRWRYAMVPRNAAGALWDSAAGIGACGDWLAGPRVENAYLSGTALAARIGAGPSPG